MFRGGGTRVRVDLAVVERAFPVGEYRGFMNTGVFAHCAPIYAAAQTLSRPLVCASVRAC